MEDDKPICAAMAICEFIELMIKLLIDQTSIQESTLLMNTIVERCRIE